MDARYSKLPGSNGRRVGRIERTPFRRRYSRFDLHAFPLAGVEALIVRSKTGVVTGPLLPNQDENVDVVRVDINELQAGKLSQNVRLQDNDTIFVPRAELIYIFGQVKSPGSFALKKGMTVLQALSLAGGLTDRGATNRIKIVRIVNGKKTDVKVKLEDGVQPGDTIIVAERFF